MVTLTFSVIRYTLTLESDRKKRTFGKNAAQRACNASHYRVLFTNFRQNPDVTEIPDIKYVSQKAHNFRYFYSVSQNSDVTEIHDIKYVSQKAHSFRYFYSVSRNTDITVKPNVKYAS